MKGNVSTSDHISCIPPHCFFLMALTEKKYSSTCLMRIAIIAQLSSKQAKQARIQQQGTFVTPVWKHIQQVEGIWITFQWNRQCVLALNNLINFNYKDWTFLKNKTDFFNFIFDFFLIWSVIFVIHYITMRGRAVLEVSIFCLYLVSSSPFSSV